MNSVTRRLTFLAAALALGACAPAPPSPASPPAPAAAPAPAPVPVTGEAARPAGPEPQRGGVFYLAYPRQIPHLAVPQNSSPDVQNSLHMAYDTLVDLDFRPFEDWRTHFRVAPALAEKWELKNPTTYVFQIRRGVRWHDGTPFTARDVAWVYDYSRDAKNEAGGRRALQDVQEVATPDDHTLQITTRTPQVNFLVALTDNFLSVFPRHVYERGDDPRQVVIGTGAFKLESYDRQKGLVYARNDDYWNKPRPYLDKIHIFTGLDRAAQTAAFFAKQADAMKVTDKPQLDPILRSAPEAKSAPFLRDIESPITMKLDRPPFNDIRVRRAMHLAIDRQAMIGTLTFGTGIANPPGMNGGRTGWVIPQEELKTLPGWRQPKEQDRAEARRLLAEAGFANGFTFTMLVDKGHTDASSQAEVISAQVREVGINMKIDIVETAVYEKRRGEGDFDAWLGSISRFSPEKEWNEFFRSGGRLNQFPISDPELDRLIEEQNSEFDEAKRKQMWIDIQRVLLKNQYVVPTITYTNYLIWQSWVGGWVDNFAGQASNLDWGQTWLYPDKVPPGRS
ncbi:MAG: ABC transporter substrate-binding protein [Chloroflexi bacterium]|nr:ABC transporter substrate-binding protein [Chloroflexota bacterium]